MSNIAIPERDLDTLVNTVHDIKIISFNTPSSFYVRLTEEDSLYDDLEREMFLFYNCYESFSEKTYAEALKKSARQTLRIKDLRPQMLIAVEMGLKWYRCLTELDPQECIAIDSGMHFKLHEMNEERGIRLLVEDFCVLPPRAILCGLAHITPSSPEGHLWTKRACDIFSLVTDTRNLKALFCQRGLLNNSMYVFITSLGEDGGCLHVNVMMVAFDTALPDITDLHHPIWPNDISC